MPAFKPEEHFRNLKGQQYLEVKWRIVWFREEHPDGYVATELVEHDHDTGMAVFKARVGYVSSEHGTDVYATGYGSETRKDFTDYLEKAETKAIGRAFAMLGYGTAQAIELDEGVRIVDSPVDARPRTSTALITPVTDRPDAIQAILVRLSDDAEAKALLPKGVSEMDNLELAKTLHWLKRRAENRPAQGVDIPE